MNEPKRAVSWMQDYLAAWKDNDPDDIGELFSAGAEYYTAPYRTPWTGRAEIVEGWLSRRDDPDDWDFRFELLAETEDLSIVEGVTEYFKQGRTYSNLWLIWLNDEGKCTRFVEYWMLNDET